MNKVVIEHREMYDYPKTPPFRPSEPYPEIMQFNSQIGDEINNVYDMVRNSFYLAGYDIENYGKANWNPLYKLVKPGNTVLIKPNLVMDYNDSNEGEECLYTQPSVVAAVLDYVYIALKGRGSIIIGDAPMQECKFDKLLTESGYDKLVKYCRKKYSGIDIRIIDFRGIHSDVVNGVHLYTATKQSGILVDLGEQSAFSDMNDYQAEHIRITNYDPDLLQKHHNRNRHEYLVSEHVLNADVIINMPKPKTHRKAGVTISMKNLVGINVRKEYLPHHTNGAVEQGGDEYLTKSFLKEKRASCLDHRNREAQSNQNVRVSRLWNVLIRLMSYMIRKTHRDKFEEGSWYGNHTICKTILDLNRIIFYADNTGIIQDEVQRRYLVVADMIISGEKEGPVAPSPKNVGMIAIGENPVAFDLVIAKLMGADINRIPTLSQLKDIKDSKFSKLAYPDALRIISNDVSINGCEMDNIPQSSILHFIPTSGWRGVFDAESGK